jgi:alpha-tubulin suppressor-like RCC1 family protein
VVSIGAGHSHSAAVTSEGELYMWGMKNYLEPQLLKVNEYPRMLQRGQSRHTRACRGHTTGLEQEHGP